jgi:hypothetical protein
VEDGVADNGSTKQQGAVIRHSYFIRLQRQMCPRTMCSVVYLIELQTTVNRVEEIIEEGSGDGGKTETGMQTGLMWSYSESVSECYKR